MAARLAGASANVGSRHRRYIVEHVFVGEALRRLWQHQIPNVEWGAVDYFHDPRIVCYQAPWQAHAFAMTLSLHERGVFTWSEWATALSEEIRSAQRAGDSDRGDTYYLHWLKALEALVTRKGVTSNVELARYERAWRNAAQRTVHGAPIVLSDVDLDQ